MKVSTKQGRCEKGFPNGGRCPGSGGLFCPGCVCEEGLV